LALEVVRYGLTFQARHGAEVKAVSTGIVRYADELGSLGRVVIVEHVGGYHTLYGLLETYVVKVGNAVRSGSVIGTAGVDPLTSSAAAYFEVRAGERALDPIPWLKPRSSSVSN
jgi:septal ring factor EnvC (AmiA/AmiB activator)